MRQIHDTLCGIFAFFLNIFLIFVVVRCTKPSLRSYSRMVMICAVYDVVYSFVGLICQQDQQQVDIYDGVYYTFSFGIDYYFPELVSPMLLSTIQISLIVIAVTLIPTQFYYRHLLLTSTNAQNGRLIFALCLSVISGSFVGLFGYVCRLEAQKRGREYYLNQLSARCKEDYKDAFVNAIDMRDPLTGSSLVYGTSLIIISYAVAVYYGYRSLKLVRPANESDIANNSRAVQLKSQFTRNMVIQSICAFALSVLPTSLVGVSTLMYFNSPISNSSSMFSFAYLPIFNATSSLICIGPYRDYVKKILHLS
ncbi:hypothetical protein M3Y96_00571900 [Aphelenchoides besseyi]|nr:hypothetical protein M3Y96_00571900 [Aphelenchoides besseyi]